MLVNFSELFMVCGFLVCFGVFFLFLRDVLFLLGLMCIGAGVSISLFGFVSSTVFAGLERFR